MTKSKDNRTLYIGLAVGGGVVVLCVMVACGVGIVWMAGKGANGGPTPTRDELQTRLIGKTPDMALFGNCPRPNYRKDRQEHVCCF